MGRSGRPTNEFKELCRSLADSPATLREMRKILRNSDHPHFARILDFVTERGHGKVAQPLVHNTAVTLAELVPHIAPPATTGHGEREVRVLALR